MLTRSPDRGRTWEQWHDTGIVGHPYHAVSPPDGTVLLVYGYRHPPYGIPARLLDAECEDLGEEMILRDDGGSADLSYPWACVTVEGRILVVYYFNVADGTRHIAGTWLQIGEEGVERWARSHTKTSPAFASMAVTRGARSRTCCRQVRWTRSRGEKDESGLLQWREDHPDR